MCRFGVENPDYLLEGVGRRLQGNTPFHTVVCLLDSSIFRGALISGWVQKGREAEEVKTKKHPLVASQSRTKDLGLT